MKKEIHHSHASKTLFLSTTFLLLLLLNTSTAADQPPTISSHRHLLSYNGDPLAADPALNFENPRLKGAYIALQAWKDSILSDPNNITATWTGPDVCNYTGIFCWQAPDNPCERTVAGIDINGGGMAGHIPHEVGLLFDLTLFHVSSNRFCGTLPQSFTNLKLLFELDLSNNRFVGKFPEPILQLASLKYLDIRFNEFEGQLPSQLFERSFDALFLNDNFFSSKLPETFGNSPASVIVIANNKLEGCVPPSLGNMVNLNQLVLVNNQFSSCFPSEIGKLKNLTVLDLSNNQIVGPLPNSIGDMESLEQLGIGNNMMSENIPESICQLPKLAGFGYGGNYFSEESPVCLNLLKFDDKMNCFRGRPEQRTTLECQRFLARKNNCSSFDCPAFSPPTAPPSVSSPPPGSPYPLPAPPPSNPTPPPCACVQPPPTN
ncbi:hypothetical protein ACP275_01G027200 [Erythranthe tilingii]